MQKTNPIGDYIRIERAKTRMSQSELAKKSKYTQSGISEIEGGLRGSSAVRDETLMNIFVNGFEKSKKEALKVVVILRIKEQLGRLEREDAQDVIKKLELLSIVV